MIKEIKQRHDDLISIKLKKRSDYISCQVFYSFDNENWMPASIYPSLDKDFELNYSSSNWNIAQQDGIVRLYNSDIKTIYWNKHINIDDYTGIVYIKIIFIVECEYYHEEREFRITDKGVVYLDDWETYLGNDASKNPNSNEKKWHIVCKNEHYVTMKYKEELPTIKVPLNVAGNYAIYFGIRKGIPRFMARIDDENYRRFTTNGWSMELYKSCYSSKLNREIFWRKNKLNKNTFEIAQLKETTIDNKAYSCFNFGELAYIKLVPIMSDRDDNQNICKLKTNELILYYEAGSYAYHGFYTGKTQSSVMLDEYIRLKPQEITCQTVRVGMRCLHYSSFLEKQSDPVWWDYNIIVDDTAKLIANCDILKESIEYMKGKGIKFTANIGMNRPYLFLPEYSEKFTRENPHLINPINNHFDYSKNEVRNYALKIIYEIIDNYDIDGLFFDYMRAYYNQTVGSIVDIISRSRERLYVKQKLSNRKLELKVRIPADDPVFYEAMKICIEKEHIDGIIPSNVFECEPYIPIIHYKNLCKESSVKVFGCIDGWKNHLGGDPRAGSLSSALTPNDFKRLYDYYNDQGVDGIFLYQSDLITSDPYLYNMF